MRGSLAGLRRVLASLLCIWVYLFICYDWHGRIDESKYRWSRSASCRSRALGGSESSRGVYDGLRAACRPRATVQSRPPARERGDPAPTVDNSKISMVSFSTSPPHMLMVGWWWWGTGWLLLSLGHGFTDGWVVLWVGITGRGTESGHP